MTGGKARQKRNGPGGSGCFHAFCYFLRPAGAGALRGGGRPARTWCTYPRKTLFLRFLCTKSESLFGDQPARTWCTTPRKALFLRFLCTKSGGLFGERTARTWCTNSRKTLFLRFLCTKSGCLFGARPAQTWCTIPRKALFLRFPCTKFGRPFGDQPARRRPSGIRSHQYKSQRERIDDERPISPPSSSILIIPSHLLL